jgi:hypothetical protein
VFAQYLEATLGANLPSYPLNSPFQQVAHYHGTVYLGIQVLMDALGAGQLVFEARKDGSDGESSSGGTRQDDEYVPVTDHQLFDYLRQPNPADTFSDFICQAVVQWHLTGRLLVWGVANKWGLPTRFYVLPTALCTPAYGLGNDLYPKGAWRVQQYYPASGMMGILPGPLAGTAGAVIDAREIYMIQNPHPLYKWACFSPLVGVDTEVDIIEMIDRSVWSVYQQGVTASGILSVPGAGETQVSDVEARINNKYAGPNNAGKIWVMGQRPDSRGMSYQPLRPDPASMSYETRSVFEGLILAAVCGIDRKVAGLAEGGSYSDRWAAIQDVRHRKYEPWLSKIAAMLTNGPMRQWGLAQRGVLARVQLPRLNDPVMTQADTNAMAADGTGTVDEVRARRGQGPHPSGLGNYPANVMVQILGLQAEAGNVQVKPPQTEFKITYLANQTGATEQTLANFKIANVTLINPTSGNTNEVELVGKITTGAPHISG